MPKASLRFAAMLIVLLVLPLAASAQSWSGAQQEVWKVVTDSWESIIQEDVGWSDQYVHPNAIVWGDQNPMPRTRDSVKRWDRYQFENASTLAHELSPTGIVVQGNTAVAHYYYSLGTENRKGERRTIHGRCTDVLTNEGGNWLFLAWNCGNESTGSN